MFVVVINEFAQDSLELAPMKNQHPLEALTSNGAYEALGERIRTRGLNGRADDPDPVGCQYSDPTSVRCPRPPLLGYPLQDEVDWPLVVPGAVDVPAQVAVERWNVRAG